MQCYDEDNCVFTDVPAATTFPAGKKWIEVIGCGIVALIAGIIVLAAILYATSDECWYAGQHDSQHRMVEEGQDCGCYARLVAKAKEGR